MEETKIDFVETDTKKKNGKFKAKCYHCKEKEIGSSACKKSAAKAAG